MDNYNGFKIEFSREQLHEFNKKQFGSVAARYAKSAEQMLEQIENKRPCFIKIYSLAGHFTLWVDDIKQGEKAYNWLSNELSARVEFYSESLPSSPPKNKR